MIGGAATPTENFKKPFVTIGNLKGNHVDHNKLSDKMGRRDIQFYDLYRLNEPPNAVQDLRKEGYHWNEGIYDQEVYEDIEVPDFNILFTNEDIIT